MDYRLSHFVLMVLGLMLFLPAAGKNSPLDIQRAEVQSFIQEMSNKHQVPLPELTGVLAQSMRISKAERLILPTEPGKPRSWKAYRARFIERPRLKEGIKFWQQHQPYLERAQSQFGVPPEIIVAILGVESFYGKYQGNFRVLDVLATLAFHFPVHAARDRSAFFRAQLEEFLLYTRRYQLSIADIRGSFAGAIGIPQFMPSSINQFALDFDDDGMIDLHYSPADAIGSVAYFLKQHGWQQELEFDYPVTRQENASPQAWLANDLQAKHQASQLTAAGFVLARPVPGYLLGLVDLESADAPTEYRAGTANFFAITQYNRSFFYAAAVVDLARALLARHEVVGLNQSPTAPK
jgi:membrane-bound lytic murein transglycosylase B